MTEEEFSLIVDDITGEGVLAESEAEIIQNTIRLDETAVAQVMTKAEDITSVCITDNMKSVKTFSWKATIRAYPSTTKKGRIQ